MSSPLSLVSVTALCAVLLGVVGCAGTPGARQGDRHGQVQSQSADLVAPQLIQVSSAHESAGPTQIAGTKHFTLASESIGQQFGIDVSVPPGPGPFPVVYILDGNLMFPIVHQMSLPMVYARELPPVIFVGIGYEVERPEEVGVLRVRDLVPTYDEAFVAHLESIGRSLPDGIAPGGADAFLSFIEHDLKPFVESRYAVDREDQTLVGDSFGGLFALHVLFSAPESFDRYVAGSPSISWDNSKLLRDESAYAKTATDLPVHLFLSAGSLEATVGTDLAMVKNMQTMTKALQSRGYPGLRLTSHLFPDETHVSVIGATMSRGLRAVFETMQGPAAP